MIYRVAHKKRQKNCRNCYEYETFATIFFRLRLESSYLVFAEKHFSYRWILAYDGAVKHASNKNVTLLDDILHPDAEAGHDSPCQSERSMCQSCGWLAVRTFWVPLFVVIAVSWTYSANVSCIKCKWMGYHHAFHVSRCPDGEPRHFTLQATSLVAVGHTFCLPKILNQTWDKVLMEIFQDNR